MYDILRRSMLRPSTVASHQAASALRMRSLDQLYTQARVLSPLLQRKIKAWLRASPGMLRVRTASEGGHSTYRTAQELTENSAWDTVRWAGVKGPERAIQKITRSYGGDPSLCLDLCRESIVFSEIRDLRMCLACIRQDPAVKFVRVKNRLASAYDASATAGYRDVALNLRFDDECTRRLGVSLHVCELQLILKCFMDMKTENGHKLYVKFRDLRGE
mmetsp:Transcript_36495/g.73212  ORF Transcript_36495/g.73212 Transcript_36495/m.73212 type:complete len:217 (-) Transcript_36495:47-697(-)